jgi:hypothetical protein
MSSRQQERLTESIAEHLEPGERVLDAIVAQARGASQARTTRGAVGGAVGVAVGGAMHTKTEESHAAAKAQGLQIRSPMGLILTDRRILTARIDALSHGNVKEFLSAVPLSTVDSVERRKMFGILGARFALTVNGTDIELECTSKSDVNAFIDSFAQAKGASAT